MFSYNPACAILDFDSAQCEMWYRLHVAADASAASSVYGRLGSHVLYRNRRIQMIESSGVMIISYFIAAL
jgi:hypothetical protein